MSENSHFDGWTDEQLLLYRKQIRQRMGYLTQTYYEVASIVAACNGELARRCVKRGWEMRGYRDNDSDHLASDEV